MPSAAIRAAYGFRRTFAFLKSISGISRSEAREGSRCFDLALVFIPSPFVTSSAPSAYDAERVPFWVNFDVNGHQEARADGFAYQYETTSVSTVVENECERISECRDRFHEADAVLTQIAASFGWVPREPHG
jgi:hypothetical protein